MSGLNKVILVGNLTKDPELRQTNTQSVANLVVATNEAWIDKDRVKQERAEFHNVVVWGKQAEMCKQYLAKGRQVCIEGRIQTRSWDKDGVRQYTTEVIAEQVQFL